MTEKLISFDTYNQRYGAIDVLTEDKKSRVTPIRSVRDELSGTAIASNVQILHEFGVFLNEFEAFLGVAAHQALHQVVDAV